MIKVTKQFNNIKQIISHYEQNIHGAVTGRKRWREIPSCQGWSENWLNCFLKYLFTIIHSFHAGTCEINFWIGCWFTIDNKYNVLLHFYVFFCHTFLDRKQDNSYNYLFDFTTFCELIFLLLKQMKRRSLEQLVKFWDNLFLYVSLSLVIEHAST